MAEHLVHVRMFSILREGRQERGLPVELDVQVPSEGCPAALIASNLQLEAEAIEGVFVNHVVRGLEHVVMPGDRIAFVPHGTPGPHRFLLGLYGAGQSTD